MQKPWGLVREDCSARSVWSSRTGQLAEAGLGTARPVAETYSGQWEPAPPPLSWLLDLVFLLPTMKKEVT